MYNTLIVGIYIPFALITAIIFVVKLLRRFKRQEDYLVCHPHYQHHDGAYRRTPHG